MSASITRFGKQVLVDGEEFAQARDEEAAATIAAALDIDARDKRALRRALVALETFKTSNTVSVAVAAREVVAEINAIQMGDD